MSTNQPEDQGTPPIPFTDEAAPPTPGTMTTTASLSVWHAATIIAAAHASTEAHKPQLAGVEIRPPAKDDPAARFTMTTTDSFALARINVPAHVEGWPTVNAVLPARELAAAVAAAVKTHGKRDSREITATLTVDAAAGTWRLTTDQHRGSSTNTAGTIQTAEFPKHDQLTAALDTPSDGTAGYLPTGWNADRLAHWIGTAKKAGAEMIEWHHWAAPLKPAAIRYTIDAGTGTPVTAAVLMMPQRITS